MNLFRILKKRSPFYLLPLLNIHSKTNFQKKLSYSTVLQFLDTSLYEQLKRAERQQFPKKTRRCYEYSKNHTAAIDFPYPTKQIKYIQEHLLIDLAKENIMEHAKRRVDLFFYTLIAYYRTALFPILGQTYLQHGKGRNDEKNCITQACHSSFTPSLIDQTIFYPLTTPKKYRSLLDGTHFMDSLNSTVELPVFVNRFDSLLESTYSGRQKSLQILHNVSIGKINPVEGLNEFLIMMRNMLIEIQSAVKNNLTFKQNFFVKHRAVCPKLIELVKKGTLDNTFLEETLKINDSYIQRLLRLTPEEKAQCDGEKKSKDKIYLTNILKIQSEILLTKSKCEKSMKTS